MTIGNCVGGEIIDRKIRWKLARASRPRNSRLSYQSRSHGLWEHCDRSETLLIEVNDGYSLGCYGLASHDCAKFLATR
jgi:hypothetical protein